MKILKHSWIILLMLLAAINTGFADTVIWSEGGSGDGNTSQLVTFRGPLDHRIEIHAVKVPAVLVDQLTATAVKVGNQHGRALQIKTIHLHGDQVVVVGQRLVSEPAYNRRLPSFWLQQVRVTFPSHYLANSFDVQSLQRELERLGIKIKPKPAGPKPTQQQTG